ncbi:conserved Plasmodium protein, unknown function [Plasmodium gallinaceum]|uniref:Uncharacterized protein n=1 Tax=Plasmodium gallinaceum TaxID=5849 RepID=A0A1J1GY12_PLAGA|nr:conserved Plasmodium protein, unknown function [Plasmodium gallinaceum]CRG97190.1 conserved Plasmodium protein, unknown function [Plasmodium gallinaceum]
MFFINKLFLYKHELACFFNKVITRSHNTGVYSSNISRIFNHINNKLKNEKESKNANNFLPVYRQYENVISNINYNKMLGRDLSYCMNILSKIEYFRKNEFWLKCCNKLIKGNMIHRINVQSYYLTANSLSKVCVLNNIDLKIDSTKNTYNEKKNETKKLEILPFTCILFDGYIKFKKINNNFYHKIYDEIAIRFLLDIENMNLDSISCTLNLFSKLNLDDYNILSYYFADYFVLTKLGNNNNYDINSSFMNKDINSSTKFNKYFVKKQKTNFFIVDKSNISKLAIILHSLAKSNTIHLEFFFYCIEYFEKYFNYLNNIDICNILYSFSKNNHMNKKYNKLSLLKRIKDTKFECYLNCIIQRISFYKKFYIEENETTTFENVYSFLKNDYSLINLNNEKYEKKCLNLLLKLINYLQNENILNKISSIQISSLALSIAKIKLNSLDIFYAFNYKVHYLWKHFSLYSIADFLYAINEKNINDEQASLLLYYQFIKIIHKSYMNSLRNDSFLNKNINCIKKNARGIYFIENPYKKIHFLSEKECSLVVRIFQSFSKSDLMNKFTFLDNYVDDYFPYNIERILETISKDEKDEIEKEKETYNNKNNDLNISSGEYLRNLQNESKNSENNFWLKLNSYPSSLFPIFNNFDRNSNLLKLYTLSTFYFCINQHFDLINFENKCLLCYFSLNILHFICPLPLNQTKEELRDLFIKNDDKEETNNKFFFIYKKKINDLSLSISFSANLLFHILHIMKLETLSEICIRQIYTCLLCLYLNIINVFGISKNHLKNLKENILLCNYINLENTSKQNFRYLNYYMDNSDLDELQNLKNNIVNKNITMVSSNNNIILYLFSLEILKKINKFLDYAKTMNYQQNEMTLTSRTHNEVNNCLIQVIKDVNHKHKKNIKYTSEVIVGPFVLDCVIET